MKLWQEGSRFRQLVHWVSGESRGLTEGRGEDLLALMTRVTTLLETPVQGTSQMLLIISATNQCIRHAENLVLEALSLDNWITMAEEAALVHLRIACHEMLGLLSEACDDLRLAPVKIRH